MVISCHVLVQLLQDHTCGAHSAQQSDVATHSAACVTLHHLVVRTHLWKREKNVTCVRQFCNTLWFFLTIPTHPCHLPPYLTLCLHALWRNPQIGFHSIFYQVPLAFRKDLGSPELNCFVELDLFVCSLPSSSLPIRFASLSASASSEMTVWVLPIAVDPTVSADSIQSH